MKVLLGVAIEKLETRQDRTIKIVLGTSQEMSAENKAALFGLSDREAWAVFSTDDDITDSDIPTKKPDTLMKTKSQAQRLRSVLYVFWKQRGEQGSFESFYDSMTEQFIDWIKEKLDG